MHFDKTYANNNTGSNSSDLLGENFAPSNDGNYINDNSSVTINAGKTRDKLAKYTGDQSCYIGKS